MIGKAVVLLAVVSVCLCELQGDAVDNAIKKGLNKARYINQNGERRIDALAREVSFKKTLIQSKTADFIARAQRVQEGVAQTLGNVAEAMREKARESNKPNSVFECIDRVEENANKNVESLTLKYADSMERLERVKLENIDTYSKPIDDMHDALRVRYDRAIKQINDCKSASAVDVVVNSFRTWVDALFAEMTRIQRQVTIAMTNFNRDANTFTNNLTRQVTRIKSTSTRNIRQCLFNRSSFFEQF